MPFFLKLKGHKESVLYVISCLTECSIMIFLFSITRLMAERGSTLLELGILGGIWSFSFALCGPVAGRISDRLGRRKLLISGALLQVIVLAICSCWQPQWLLYSLACLTGIAAGMLYPAMIAWLMKGTAGGTHNRDRLRKLFLFCIAWNLGMVSGQTTGGWLFSIDPVLPVFAAIFPMGAVIVLLLGLRNAESLPSGGQIAESGPIPPRLPGARKFVYSSWVANIAGALTMSTIIHLFPHLTTQLGILPQHHGMMLAANRLTVMFIYWLMHSATFWQYRISTSLTAHLCAVIGLAFLAAGSTATQLTLGLILVAVLGASNYFASIFYSTTEFDDQDKGLASGIHEGSLAVGLGTGALGGGIAGVWLGERGPYYACAFMLILSFGAQVVIHLLPRPKRIMKTESPKLEQ